MKPMTIAGVVVLALVIVAAGWYFLRSSGSNLLNMQSGTASSAETVATVNGEAISRADLTATEQQMAAQQGINATSTEILASFQQQALDSLIAQKLLEDAAASANVTVSDDDVNTQISAIKTQFQDDASFQAALSSQGMTEDQLTSQIRSELAVQTYLDQQLNLASTTASEEEISAAYEQLTSGSTATDTPALADVHDQVEQYVIGQKQQAAASELVDQLRANADVQILI
jgi:foldase protein PrsA